MRKDFEKHLRTHAETRRLLAAALCEPDIELFREADVFARLATGLKIIAPQFHLPVLPPGDGDELLVAYTKLFLGPGHIPAPPYGSVYLDKDGLVAGPSTQAVMHFYADDGLGVEEESAELPDHAAIELEYSAHLLDKAADMEDPAVRSEILDRHTEFDERFLRSWLPDFGQRIQGAATHPFYDAIGNVLRILPPAPTTAAADGNSD